MRDILTIAASFILLYWGVTLIAASFVVDEMRTAIIQRVLAAVLLLIVVVILYA